MIDPVIEHQRPDFFGDVHAQTTTFYEQTRLIEQPIPDPFRWRDELRTIDIVPPVQRTVR